MILQINFPNKHKTFINFKILLVVILLSSTLLGCINRPISHIDYSIYATPNQDSETTLIVPVVIDARSDEIDDVMLVSPRFPKGSALVDIIETDKGTALKITLSEPTEIWFSKYYKKSGAELRMNSTLSMTNVISNEKGKMIIKSWVYVNSTANQIPRF
ncbi:MAG: hypothetical protein Q7U60_11005, partial [Candidatus Methanoperedens sp.]|nr:hypothetical protein [Candidatus Methanoperedens sp.]